MAASRRVSALLLVLVFLFCFGSPTSGNGNPNPDPDPNPNQKRCAVKVQNAADGSQRLAPSLRADNCSFIYPSGKHVIHEVTNVSFSQLACQDQASVVIHWSASPLGIEHIKGFRVYLEDKNPEGKWCQHLMLKDPRQLNFSYRNTKLSSQPFSGLTFDADYMVRVVPVPTLMNDSFFPPSFLRTNSCDVLLGPDNLVCKSFWKTKTLNVSQFGSNLHVMFDQAPVPFGFHVYFLYYKLWQDRPFKLQRCKPAVNQARTTCVLQDVTPGTYSIELRDEGNATKGQTRYHVSPVPSPWAGPIRAMAITVPLVIMAAFVTLFTVMCHKKRQENIYSELGEESGKSSNHSAALNTERPGPRPRVFMCYSNRDCSEHTGVIQSFAYFLQDFCCCEVALDLWEHLEICREGQMAWLSRRLDEADFIITVCSKGLRYYVERNRRRGKTPVSRRGNSISTSSSLIGGSGSDLFVVGVAVIAEKLRLAEGTSRCVTVYFDYSAEDDVPVVLSPAPRFRLMHQLPQLFSLLRSSQSSLALTVSRENCCRSRSGRSLYLSICNMRQHISQNPEWFQKRLDPCSTSSGKHPADPASSPAPEPRCCSTSPPPDSLQGGKGTPKRSVLLPGPGFSLGPGPGPSAGLPDFALR
ncbi:interleukin-17 receptor D [Brachionichthys hirsutus]|uniref:interleukin-17 receptor D n=1 Tax=Brachionichthys hirsutus TaxID=412623 RepID=UPI003604C717